jgi:hypothetical protein
MEAMPHLPDGQAKRGRQIATALAGSWRSSPPALVLSPAALARIAPRLLQTGGGGLAWWKVRHSPLQASPPAFQFRQAYRLHSIHSALHESHLQEVVVLLRAAGIEPLVAKGWAIARLYPEQGLRPYGDIDLCVRPDQWPSALTALRQTGKQWDWLDLHEGVGDLPDRSWQEVYRRSQLAQVGGLEVRLLSPEDQLRQLCLHLMRHGAWRPLWLCDIGAALENRPGNFDWEYCLSGDRCLTEWVLYALALASRLLGARLDDVELAGASADPPWLVASVLHLWGSEFHPLQELPMALHLRHPAGLFQAVCRRWQNPIEVLFPRSARPFRHLPRLLVQLLACAVRAAQLTTRLPGVTRNPPAPQTTVCSLHLHSM